MVLVLYVLNFRVDELFLAVHIKFSVHIYKVSCFYWTLRNGDKRSVQRPKWNRIIQVSAYACHLCYTCQISGSASCSLLFILNFLFIYTYCCRVLIGHYEQATKDLFKVKNETALFTCQLVHGISAIRAKFHGRRAVLCCSYYIFRSYIHVVVF